VVFVSTKHINLVAYACYGSYELVVFVVKDVSILQTFSSSTLSNCAHLDA
jgi:hypothetical protein